jgi:hypothetical protein
MRQVQLLFYLHFLTLSLKCDEKVDWIEQLVMKSRRKYDRNNKGGTTAHPRVRGDWKDVPLPFISASKPKIPRSAVHPNWLANNPELDTASRIEEDELAADADDESGA